jgi:hypothetical protein
MNYCQANQFLSQHEVVLSQIYKKRLKSRKIVLAQKRARFRGNLIIRIFRLKEILKSLNNI